MEQFHVMPWDIERLTVTQLRVMCDRIDQLVREGRDGSSD